MYELFTFPFFQILVSFIRLYAHFPLLLWRRRRLLLLVLPLNSSLCFLFSFSLSLFLCAVFYICFTSACSFFPSLHVLLHSIASHLIQLNSFSIVFTIHNYVARYILFRCSVLRLHCSCLLILLHQKRWLFSVFHCALPYVIYSQFHLYNLYDNVKAL